MSRLSRAQIFQLETIIATYSRLILPHVVLASSAARGSGTLASTAFFYRNIQRLFIKITSGGADDGYSTVAEPPARGRVVRTGKKQAPPPEPEKTLLDGAKKWAEFAFGRKL